jgi:hypothetical protein
MLADRDYQLLTAYVDGELSARQRKAVLRLLRRSPEARVLLRQLQSDATSVQHLPRQRPGDHFPLRVLGAIAERGLQPAQSAAGAALVRGPSPWVGWAAAAAVLLSVSTLSYLAYPLLFKKDHREPGVVQNSPGGVPIKEQGRLDKNSAKEMRDKGLRAEGPNDPPAIPMVRGDGTNNGGTPGQGSQTDVPKPKRAKNPDPVSTAPKQEPDGLRIRTPNLSVLAELRDLEQPETRELLLAKLQSADAHHGQLLCRETGQTLELLRGVLAANGVDLLVDNEVQIRLKKRRARPNLTLYAENVKPAELVQIFHQLAQAERKAVAGSKIAPPSALLLVTGMTAKLRQQTARLLHAGSPAAKLPPPKPPAAAPRRSVLVVPYFEEDAPFPPRAVHSKEVQNYRAGRAKPLSGTVQVVLELLRDNAN